MTRTSGIVLNPNHIVNAGVVSPEIDSPQSSFMSSTDMSHGDTSRLITTTFLTQGDRQGLERALVPEMMMVDTDSVFRRLYVVSSVKGNGEKRAHVESRITFTSIRSDLGTFQYSLSGRTESRRG